MIRIHFTDGGHFDCETIEFSGNQILADGYAIFNICDVEYIDTADYCDD